ncbi:MULTISPECIES: complex I NDUFA9 subunit family protein [unclassified Methylotenera]|jgi:NADH dehydrogenase|uniref:complex I NDUFA9 subunit family protein n=1 Tax=unclassified Methylotenera TaxID=2643294 RepID=UPI0003682BFA|nr:MULTISPECIES: complex I NDUFA9 subunit family protein [unclassified Methylotenera]
MKKITVLGGSGFVGSSLVAKLDAAGYQVTVISRRRESAKHLILLPNVQVVQCDIFEQQKLKSMLEGSYAVINLVGILHESGRASFEQVHHQLPRRLAQVCGELGIERLIHMSALQASKSAPSQYLRSKAAGESAVGEFSKKLNITIFKPSIIFGRHDSFFNLFASLVKLLPVIVLAKPDARFQPIWVEDVTSCMVNALENTDTYGKTYELGGPQVYSFRELIQKVMTMLGISRPIIGLSDKLSYLQGFAMEFLPVKLMSRDNVRSMRVDSVTLQTLPSELGVSLMPLEAVVPEYLTNATPRGAYDGFRSAAGRAINAKR